jgi:predicted alpha/beta-fold hydrolase
MSNSDFLPKRALRSGHAMTLYSWGKPRRFPRLPAPVERYFDVAPHVRVLAHCHWQPEPARHPALVALHGLEGSSSAHYMRGLADKAFAAGFNVLLLNQRNCGGTEELSETLYNAGLTADAAHVLEQLAAEGIDRIVVAGYSMGGNLALKLAGDFGSEAPRTLRGVCAVSPIVEIGACIRALERRPNFIYQWNFVRGLKRRMRRKQQTHPGRFPIHRLRDVRTVRDFDEYFTAPHFGFAGADDYYHRQSAMRVIDRIRVPTLIITAEDDPFVPVEPFRDPRVTSNPNIRVAMTRHGGHCGFVSSAADGGDCYWAEERIMAFAAHVVNDQ